jgi:hypothetical protein
LRLQHTYAQRWISPDGSRVFFDTVQPLVAQDTNGQEDVYEWEREGHGSCPIKPPAQMSGGCIFLLSGGSSPFLSVFIDADTGGDNVFFETRRQLAAADHGKNIKLYDDGVGWEFTA